MALYDLVGNRKAKSEAAAFANGTRCIGLEERFQQFVLKEWVDTRWNNDRSRSGAGFDLR